MEARVRGRDVIAQIVANLRSQGEELRYSTIVPAAYDVYLHPADHARLESLATVIAEQAAARIAMPFGGDGFDITDAGVIDEQKVQQAIKKNGQAVEPGAQLLAR